MTGKISKNKPIKDKVLLDYLGEGELILKSVDFWAKKMEDEFKTLDKLEKELKKKYNPEIEKETLECLKRMEDLALKGNVEYKEVDEYMWKTEKFLSKTKKN